MIDLLLYAIFFLLIVVIGWRLRQRLHARGRPDELSKSVPILPVTDVRAALKSYQSLGFTTDIYEEADGTAIYGFLRREGLELHLNLFRDLDPETNTSAVYFYVSDPDSIYEEWTKANVQGRLAAPEPKSWGMREMAYIDPDGNLLRIGSPLAASVPQRKSFV